MVKGDQTVEVRPLEIATIQGDTAIIQSGIDVGEQVVAEGQNQLRPGEGICGAAPEPSKASGPRKPR